jgi:hypothetical protein
VVALLEKGQTGTEIVEALKKPARLVQAAMRKIGV